MKTTQKMKMTPKKEYQLNNENDPKKEVQLKIEEGLKNDDPAERKEGELPCQTIFLRAGLSFTPVPITKRITRT